MNKLKAISILFLILALGCNSPDALDCFQTAGEKKVSKLNGIPEFERLVIFDDINLEIVNDDTVYFELDYYENLMPEVEFEIDNNSLVFTNKNSCNFVRSFKSPTLIYHTNKASDFITSRSAGKIFNRDTLRNNISVTTEDVSNEVALLVNNQQTIFSSNSSTNFKAMGSTENLRLFSYFNDSQYNCEDLKARRVQFLQRGYNDFLVNVQDSLVGSIENSGRVIYKGNPGVKVSIDGDGQLIRL